MIKWRAVDFMNVARSNSEVWKVRDGQIESSDEIWPKDYFVHKFIGWN
jgi:hypothetical protein